MKRNMVAFVITAVFLASAAWANTVIETYSCPTWGVTNNFTGIAQTFTAPADSVLVSFKFGIAPRSSNGKLTFSIYNWVGESPVGVALYSVSPDWTASTGDILVPGINLPLTTGSLYGAVIDLQGYNLDSVHWVEGDPYEGGDGFWTKGTWPSEYVISGVDLQFLAEFVAAPPDPTPPVPDPEPPFVPVTVLIDIKPGGYPNSINLRSEGVVPVAIMTTSHFAANTVDPTTVTFADAAPIKWRTKDVDSDGNMDMLLFFKTQDLQLDENSTEATLIGMTYDETDITGTDSVNIVPKGKKK